ncbi:MAG: hypothetical protein WCH34_12120 [Bacteroidota bacterium]
MKQIVLNVPDNKFNFFMELVRDFKYIKVEKSISISNDEIIEGIKTGLKEVELIEKGEMKATPLKDFLNEL